ncbi:MAG: histidine kinase [Rhodobacterales bacterium]|nr:MAG: histidine kinase [Rhodobacterales bacterium]
MITWDRVNELRDEIGADDFQEVVEIFLEEVDEVIERLKETPDPACYEQDMHFLKGSALNLGFAQFSELCQSYETAAANGKTDVVCLGPLFELYAASKAAFLSGIGHNQAA